MRSPYFMSGETVVSFSGGRSSAFMLAMILDAHGGALPDDVRVLFANTGKEAEETLAFVEDCARYFSVRITWLEYQAAELPKDRWRVVDFATASRNGEPLEQLFVDRRFLPNPVNRICTAYAKIKPMKYYARDVLGFSDWDVAIGFRADEPERVARLAVNGRDGFERIAPMAKAGVSAADVSAFWRGMPFDLQLPDHDGVTPNGNCDLCFLKGGKRVFSLIEEKPERALWWMAQEERRLADKPSGNLFRKDRPSYRQMYEAALAQSGFCFADGDIADCYCTGES
jgi:3'-phosphoadenosine 5'-phosphosulfate sulfotransferase (PAPS reductase)/FAD synthetase